jgi:hypothetical protein
VWRGIAGAFIVLVIFFHWYLLSAWEKDSRWDESLTAEKNGAMLVAKNEAGLLGRIPRMDGRGAPEAFHLRRDVR